jgi:hypothetical protein
VRNPKAATPPSDESALDASERDFVSRVRKSLERHGVALGIAKREGWLRLSTWDEAGNWKNHVRLRVIDAWAVCSYGATLSPYDVARKLRGRQLAGAGGIKRGSEPAS